jgi:D-beta-D-heptose 7-phosphate kinase/D-beta-D-heptose 1-phosphate adenosyltransferase
MKQYETIISHFKNKKIAVIGELVLDSYLKGFSNRICREAPVPIVDVSHREDAPGGGSNTAINVAALGIQTYFISVCGNDEEGERTLSLLQEKGVNTDCVIKDKSRATLTKQRVLADNHLLLRFDQGSTEDISNGLEQNLITNIKKLYKECDAVILSDYDYGILTPAVIDTVARLKKDDPKPVIVDGKNLLKYTALHPTAVKPNYGEATTLLNLPKEQGEKRVEQIYNEGPRILEVTGAEIVSITMDKNGGWVFEKGKEPFRTYTKPANNMQAAGAGDTYVSALAAAFACGTDTHTATSIASAAAAVVVQKEGTSTCSSHELITYFNVPTKKIISKSELNYLSSLYKEQGKKVVFTNGFFDVLQSSHVAFLEKVKKQGDILIVGVNNDESSKRVLGPEFPLNSLSERMKVLTSLSSIDHLISFEEDNAVSLAETLKPDVYVKGGNYRRDQLIEGDVVEKYGGKVVILPYLEEEITKNMMKRIYDLDPAISSLYKLNQHNPYDKSIS